MKANFKWIYALFLVLSVQLSFAQEKTVTGTVTEAGQPLPGVTVIVKGTNVGTQTDFDGKFSIKARVGAVLEFTYIGMKTQNITVAAANVINVAMVEDVEVLGEVVVQAYRTTTREKSNISSTTVTAKTIEARPNASFIQTLQGQVPGLNISTGSGQPGSNSKLSCVVSVLSMVK
jgi:TonB-dependent starch-binding outer membrane protein SusC